MTKLVKLLSEKLRIWHFLILVVVSVPLSGWLLRQNNLKMIELRDQVISIDEETGDLAQIEPRIKELAEYVFGHMNTDAGQVALPGAYNTEVERIRAAAEASGSANSAIYGEAQRECEDPFIPLPARAQCVQDYVVAHAAPGTDPVLELEFPDVSLFTYSFAAPLWSPDLAGFSVLVAALDSLILILLVISRVVLPFFGRMIDRDPLE